jgi:uncharacterized protein YcgI (DUF1989 family)
MIGDARSTQTAETTLTAIERFHLEPQTGHGFRLQQGQILRVIDPEGEQVADLTAFAADGSGEWLSSGRSIDYANTIYLTTGHTLYSNMSRPMFTLLHDMVGRHDFLLTPCSLEMFRKLYGVQGDHPSCFGNLESALRPFGIETNAIPTTLNIFMNVVVDPSSGELTIGPPLSRPGDYLELRAEMDLIVGLTACSAEKSNNHRFKPIHAEIYRGL